MSSGSIRDRHAHQAYFMRAKRCQPQVWLRLTKELVALQRISVLVKLPLKTLLQKRHTEIQ